ncbi:MAG: TRAP transporter small permease subunit [Burkholderiales bacterium]|nr:TRAP transporter small permease subunit [Burkholderiales bacterium]
MTGLLRFALGMDRISGALGKLAAWAVLLAALISAGNAVVRYGLDISSNGWLEIQWYLFSVTVMLGAPVVLKLNEHVRVDIIYGKLPRNGPVYVDLFGLTFFLLPVMGMLAWMTWGFFWTKLAGNMTAADTVASLGLWGYLARLFTSGEISSNAGGLIRWPVALLMPLGFALMFLQGVAEILKRVAYLRGALSMDTHYEKPLQ